MAGGPARCTGRPPPPYVGVQAVIARRDGPGGRVRCFADVGRGSVSETQQDARTKLGVARALPSHSTLLETRLLQASEVSRAAKPQRQGSVTLDVSNAWKQPLSGHNLLRDHI